VWFGCGSGVLRRAVEPWSPGRVFGRSNTIRYIVNDDRTTCR
jgi:hypothetical protein